MEAANPIYDRFQLPGYRVFLKCRSGLIGVSLITMGSAIYAEVNLGRCLSSLISLEVDKEIHLL